MPETAFLLSLMSSIISSMLCVCMSAASRVCRSLPDANLAAVCPAALPKLHQLCSLLAQSGANDCAAVAAMCIHESLHMPAAQAMT